MVNIDIIVFNYKANTFFIAFHFFFHSYKVTSRPFFNRFQPEATILPSLAAFQTLILFKLPSSRIMIAPNHFRNACYDRREIRNLRTENWSSKNILNLNHWLAPFWVLRHRSTSQKAFLNCNLLGDNSVYDEAVSCECHGKKLMAKLKWK